MGVAARRQREFERREQELLEAALELFDGQNWDLVTVAEITRHAEMGKGTFYKHFGSKEEIYARLALDFKRSLHAKLRKLDRTRAEPAAIVREFIETALAHYFEDRRYVHVAQYAVRQDFKERLEPETREAFAAIESEAAAMIQPVLERGMAEGDFARKPIEQHLVGVVATFHGAIAMVWDLQCGSPFLDLPKAHFARTIADFTLAGLGARVSDASS